MAVLPALDDDGRRDNPRDYHSGRGPRGRHLASLITQRVPNQGPRAARGAAVLTTGLYALPRSGRPDPDFLRGQEPERARIASHHPGSA